MNERLTVIETYGAMAVVACPDCTDGQSREESHLLRGIATTEADRKKLTPMLQVRLTTLTDYEHQADAFSACEALLAQPRGWLTLAGLYGVGKSTLLWATFNHLRDAGMTGQYFTASRMLDFIKAGIGLPERSGQSERERVQRLIDLPVLVVDELDKAGTSEYVHRKLFDVLDGRYQYCEDVVTLLAYNDPLKVSGAEVITTKDGEQVIGPLHSRMHDKRFQFVELNGPDIRPVVEWVRNGSGGKYEYE